MAYKLLIVEDEKEKATGIAYLTGKYNPECRPVLLAHDGREGYEKDRKSVVRKPPQSSRILLLRISECLKWTDWK